MTTKRELKEIQDDYRKFKEIQDDYRKFADYLLTRLEESQKRYMAAERVLFTLLPWYGRIFAKKKILVQNKSIEVEYHVLYFSRT